MFSFDFRSQFKNCIFFINIFYYDVMWSAIFLLGLEMWWNKPVSYFMRVSAFLHNFSSGQVFVLPDITVARYTVAHSHTKTSG